MKLLFHDVRDSLLCDYISGLNEFNDVLEESKLNEECGN